MFERQAAAHLSGSCSGSLSSSGLWHCEKAHAQAQALPRRQALQVLRTLPRPRATARLLSPSRLFPPPSIQQQVLNPTIRPMLMEGLTQRTEGPSPAVKCGSGDHLSELPGNRPQLPFPDLPVEMRIQEGWVSLGIGDPRVTVLCSQAGSSSFTLQLRPHL